MVHDEQGKINTVAWTVYGKIDRITKNDGSTVQYTYDASGNRISKVANGVETWYVRDATGNVMATYTKGDVSINSGNLTQAEVDLYGSSRLGLLNTSVNCSNGNQGPTALGNAWDATYNRGQKLFELTNHLGNVLATVTDRLVPVPDASGAIIDYNLADVASANDYYSFGMPMPGRTYSAGTQYRYGFNGQEKSTEIAEGLTTATYWEYDSRIGRRWNVDPLAKVNGSPYLVLSNSPINRIDLKGNDDKWQIDKKTGAIKLISSTQTGSNIIVLVGDKEMLLSDVQIEWKSKVSSGIADIVATYAVRAGLKFNGNCEHEDGAFPGGVGIAPGIDNSESVLNSAFFSQKENNIYVSVNDGKISPVLSDYNNLQSVLKHEDKHKNDFSTNTASTIERHFQIYLEGIQDINYKSTTRDFKIGDLGSALNYLYTLKENGIEDDKFEKYYKNLYKTAKENGLRFKADYNHPAAENEKAVVIGFTITDVKTNENFEGTYKKMDN